MRRRWSKVEEAKLCELWTAGASMCAISTRLERSPASCGSKVDRLRDDCGVDLALRNPAGAVRK